MKTQGLFLLIMYIYLSFVSMGQTAVAPTGSGTSGSPYQIATWQNLYWISQNSAQWNKHYIQTADIDFAEASPAINTWASGAGWTPIGNATTAFTGSYNGQGYSIIGLYINNSSGYNLGLFGYITGNSSASISNLFIQGSVSGSYRIAALVGYVASSNIAITNCHSNATITSTRTTSDSFADTGGLIGIVANGSPTITNCSSSGSVTGQGLRNVGGLLGYLNSGTVQKSFSTANIVNSASNQGNTGGFIGGVNSDGNNTLIENCFATGNVSGGANNNSTEWRNGIGGFIGTKRTEYSGYTKTIRYCYSTGIVSKTGTSTDIGGFIGRFATNYASSVSPTITNCYWDTQRTTQTTSAGGAGTGLTTAQMKVQSNFTSWDFSNTWKMSSTITYDGYPTLEWAKGYATAPTSNQIASLNNLVYLAENSSRWATAYTQTADVNAWWTCGWDYQKGWTPIGNNTTKYTGTTYDGDNYEINHLFINRTTSDFQGFFGYINGAEVKDLGFNHANISARSSLGALSGSGDNVTIRNCYVTGSISGIGSTADFTGGMIGDSRGNSLIENSYANVTVSGLHNVGALVGRTLNNGSTSTVRYCYSKGTVTGTGGYIGGLAGQNNGTISNCFSEATVKGSGYKVGGLVGFQWYGTIDKCYSRGSVTGSSELGGLVGGRTGSTTTNSYWDTQTSGRATSVEGTAKSTADMKLASTYIVGGWDFVKANNVWAMNYSENSGYPFLRTQAFNPAMIWLGTNTTAWETAGNWSEAEAPASASHLIIANATNSPIVADGVTATANNITIETGAELTANANGRLTVSGNVVNNGTFSLKSDDVASSTLKITGSFSGTGTYNMQAYLTAGRNWYVSSPVSGAKSSVFNAASNPVYWYDEAHGSTVPWAVINNNTVNLTPMRGYIATVPSNGNVTFTGGAFNNSNETLTVYRTAGQAKEGFNLVGNPYPAYFDYEAATKQDIMETFWVRSRNEANTGWIFDTYNTLTNLGVSPSGKHISGKIPPMQAFWVRVSPTKTSGTIAFAKTHTSHADNAGNIRRAPKVEQQQFVRLRLHKDETYDETIVAFFPNAHDEIDRYDSHKMLNASANVPDIYSMAGSEILAINSLKTFEGERRIPLYYSTQQSGEFKISANQIVGFNTFSNVILYDFLLGTEHDLLLNGAYHFTSSKATSLNRFELIVKIPGLNTDLHESHVSPIVKMLDNSKVLIDVRTSGFTQADVYDVAGKLLASYQLTELVTVVPMHYVGGIYVIKLKNNNGQLQSFKMVF